MNRLLIATDLDGTLLNSDSVVSQVSKDALARAASEGHTIVAVTGRSWRTSESLLASIEPIETIICSNGAYEYDMRTRTVRLERTFSTDDCREMIDAMKRRYPTVLFGWENHLGLNSDDGFSEAVHYDGNMHGDPENDTPTTLPLYKLLIRVPGMEAVDLQHALRDILDSRAEVATSGAPFVEITPPGWDKGSALAHFAARKNMTAEQTMAFGDNHNDLPMLHWAGISVAMENAEPTIQEQARFVTAHHTQHGVASFLQDYLWKTL